MNNLTQSIYNYEQQATIVRNKIDILKSQPVTEKNKRDLRGSLDNLRDQLYDLDDKIWNLRMNKLKILIGV